MQKVLVKNDSKKGVKEQPNTKPDLPKPKVYSYNQVNFSNTVVPPVDLKTKFKQYSSFINYLDPIRNVKVPLLVKTGNLKLVSGGIPKIDPIEKGDDRYIKSDKDREYINIPFDSSNEASNDLRQHLEMADAYFGSVDFAKTIFGKAHTNYNYLPLIKIKTEKKSDSDSESESESGSEEEEEKAKKEKAKKKKSKKK
jgi:hypothetical protein